ncbi:putative outer membrane porin [Escherichia coli]|uniref:Putative outer membrane porin n=1 Tax=Escherichia coli TaxID=562 RepID=A0A376LKU9_ECOLX|nr:putative outer membrane porin [Escherichia coli]
MDLRLEGTWVKADGQQGYFLQRMTPTYASSNGRLDIWWDNRSDFNANGEKAVFFGAMYDLKNWNLPGFAIGASYVYAWDAKPATWQSNPDAYYDKNQTIEESAYSLDASTPFRTVAPKARCSNCTSPNTTTTPTSQAGAVVTATSSRMSVT